jgi:hypothetical protein
VATAKLSPIIGHQTEGSRSGGRANLAVADTLYINHIVSAVQPTGCALASVR